MLAEAADEAAALLAKAKRPMILAGVEIHRFGLQDKVLALAEKHQLPIAATILGKSVVPEKHPLYAALTKGQPKAAGEGDEFREKLRGYGMTPTEEPEVLWNFEKFLIAKDGSVAARFAPGTTPDDPTLVSAIEAELAK